MVLMTRNNKNIYIDSIPKYLKEKDEDLQFHKCFMKIAQGGGDLEILLAFLEEGELH